MSEVQAGDLIRRRTDGMIASVKEVGDNFVKVDMPAPGGGVYHDLSVKEYDVVVECNCCNGIGYLSKDSERPVV